MAKGYSTYESRRKEQIDFADAFLGSIPKIDTRITAPKLARSVPAGGTRTKASGIDALMAAAQRKGQPVAATPAASQRSTLVGDFAKTMFSAIPGLAGMTVSNLGTSMKEALDSVFPAGTAGATAGATSVKRNIDAITAAVPPMPVPQRSAAASNPLSLPQPYGAAAASAGAAIPPGPLGQAGQVTAEPSLSNMAALSENIASAGGRGPGTFAPPAAPAPAAAAPSQGGSGYTARPIDMGVYSALVEDPELSSSDAWIAGMIAAAPAGRPARSGGRDDDLVDAYLAAGGTQDFNDPMNLNRLKSVAGAWQKQQDANAAAFVSTAEKKRQEVAKKAAVTPPAPAKKSMTQEQHESDLATAEVDRKVKLAAAQDSRLKTISDITLSDAKTVESQTSAELAKQNIALAKHFGMTEKEAELENKRADTAMKKAQAAGAGGEAELRKSLLDNRAALTAKAIADVNQMTIANEQDATKAGQKMAEIAFNAVKQKQLYASGTDKTLGAPYDEQLKGLAQALGVDPTDTVALLNVDRWTKHYSERAKAAGALPAAKGASAEAIPEWTKGMPRKVGTKTKHAGQVWVWNGTGWEVTQ
jgi:hypothetical protein